MIFIFFFTYVKFIVVFLIYVRRAKERIKAARRNDGKLYKLVPFWPYGSEYNFPKNEEFHLFLYSVYINRIILLHVLEEFTLYGKVSCNFSVSSGKSKINYLFLDCVKELDNCVDEKAKVEVIKGCIMKVSSVFDILIIDIKNYYKKNKPTLWKEKRQFIHASMCRKSFSELHIFRLNIKWPSNF